MARGVPYSLLLASTIIPSSALTQTHFGLLHTSILADDENQKTKWTLVQIPLLQYHFKYCSLDRLLRPHRFVVM